MPEDNTETASEHTLTEIDGAYVLELSDLVMVARVIVAALLEDHDLDTARAWARKFRKDDKRGGWQL